MDTPTEPPVENAEPNKIKRKPEARTAVKWLLAQTFIEVVLVFFVAFAYVNNLWSQRYLEEAAIHWKHPPIVDVQFVNLRDSSGSIVEGYCPEGYEVGSIGRFEGNNAGCNCLDARKGLFSDYSTDICSRNETAAGCLSIDRLEDPIEYKIYDGNLICVKKDKDLDFYKIERPLIKKGSDKVEATCQEGQISCGSHELDHEYQICIPDTKQCPIVDLIFTQVTNPDGTTELKLLKNTDSLQLPIIVLKMSEYGPPCIDKSEENVYPDKAKHPLMQDDNYQGCTIKLEDQYHSPQFRIVIGAPPVSEYIIYVENPGIKDVIRKLPYYQLDEHKNYYYNLYQMSYPHWKYKCHSADDGFPVHPKDVRNVIDTAKSLKSYAIAVLILSIVLTLFTQGNIISNIMNYRRAIKTSTNRKCTYVRVIFTFLLALTCFGLLAKMYMDSDPYTISYLSVNECSNDPILNQSFVKMDNYFSNIRAKHITTIVFLALIITIDIMIYLATSYSKYMRKRRERRMKLITEHLLNKQRQQQMQEGAQLDVNPLK